LAIGSIINHYFFDRSCIYCAKAVLYEPNLLCSKCWNLLEFQGDHVEGADILLADDEVYFNELSTILAYNDIIREILHRIKYYDDTRLCSLLAKFIGNYFDDVISRYDVVTIIPLHYKRMLRRKYNQIDLLMRYISGDSKYIYSPDLLMRVRNTCKQSSLAKLEDKRRNLENAFSVRSGSREGVLGRKILIIDDIITSGSTVNNCAKELKRHGASGVGVLALARAG
jgi:ComF family protein